MTTENEFQDKILDYAKLRGWLAYHTYDSRKSAPGYPDLTLVRNDRIIFAELKTERGRVTPEQSIWIDALNRTPATALIWRPSNWEEIARILE